MGEGRTVMQESNKQKQSEAKEIQAHTDEFIKNGGNVEYIPANQCKDFEVNKKTGAVSIKRKNK